MIAEYDWLEPYCRQCCTVWNSNWSTVPYGRVGWKKAAEKYCGAYWGRLTPEHCMRIHYRFTQMRKEIDGLSVEYGMIRGPNWDDKTQWPYAAVARFDDQGKMLTGYLLHPGAASCPYYVRHSLPVPGKSRGTTYRSLRTVEDMMPVIKPVTGEAGSRSATVTITRDDVARTGDVRKGDCYLFDLTMEHSPRVTVEGRYMGRAVQFGALDEIIDTVRCRLVFADLPSA
jgi:hypothetical protein